jgi:hypothetical protein
MGRYIKYTLTAVIGVVLVAGMVTNVLSAWSAVWHGTDWIANGAVLDAQKIAENFEYLLHLRSSVCTEHATGRVRYNNGVLEYCDTSQWITLPPLACSPKDVQTFTNGGVWQKPSCGTTVTVECWGGGGSGWCNRWDGRNLAGAGGGGGGYARSVFDIDTLPQAVTVVVGAGSPKGDIASGGVSAFGPYLSAFGGQSGGVIYTYWTGTVGGLAEGDYIEYGGDGGYGGRYSGGGQGENRTHAGAGGSGGSEHADHLITSGGVSVYGGDGGYGGGYVTNNNGTFPGGGGGGSNGPCWAGYGSSGANGMCRIVVE